MYHTVIAKILFVLAAISLAYGYALADSPFITKEHKTIAPASTSPVSPVERIVRIKGVEYSLSDESAYAAFRRAPAAEKNKYPLVVRMEYFKRIKQEIEAKRKNNPKRRNVKPAAKRMPTAFEKMQRMSRGAVSTKDFIMGSKAVKMEGSAK